MLSDEEISEQLEGHAARNRELIRSIKSQGVDVDKRYLVEHHFWSPDSETATALGALLATHGYAITRMNPTQTDTTFVWNVEAEINRSLAEASDAVTTEQLVRLAARFDSIYDGWGASI